MEFCIQVSNPRLNKTDTDLETSLEDAIEEIYPLFSEKVIMVWNGLYIPLSYKYDISIMITDIMNLLDSLISDYEGSYNVWWPSNTFSAKWELNWSKGRLKVNAQWESVIGNIEENLNSIEPMDIDKNTFLCEWKKLLSVLLDNLSSSGYDRSNIPEIGKLYELEQKIKSFGVLYN